MDLPISQTYKSPRWSGEICDCSMPMTLDTYSTCSYNCLYCFAFFLKNKSMTGYQKHADPMTREVKCVNVDKVKRLFTNCLNDTPQNKIEKQFYPYIKNRVTFQWSGLSDMFDEFERKYGVSLELLKFFDEIDYPISMGSKGVCGNGYHYYNGNAISQLNQYTFEQEYLLGRNTGYTVVDIDYENHRQVVILDEP